MMLFLQLLIAHLLGDFAFQPFSWVKHKEKHKIKSKKLYYHIGVHALLLMITLAFNTTYWAGFLLIILTHFLIDLGKLYLQKKKNKRLLFFIDQLLHIVIIIVVTYLYKPFEVDFQEVFSEKNLLLVASLAFVTHASSVIISVIITQWAPQINLKNDEKSLIKAGKYIGILERLFVFMFVALGKWEGVGFLLAAKSIFRFGDLTEAKDRKLTEYILIGTLLSFGLAILTGLVYSQYGR
ncbi:DUF3307 domain-containing protein [Tenacibaculum sp. IB213877]|uniref:DUF3307 domain-containing protein n=1 Tax=Tenacibaculum sp. IB213877 TaxID=3097351 RepID=UPI002A5A343E|nr:DUF3307 domain-containing protein [Tenacibaculum sp. IB213877]MDY0779659.1 DUF3307 domain-containing protein [Tenacibaculum sp. IB213877]